jgi:quercetin dioxygenase-like cupin family protein
MAKKYEKLFLTDAKTPLSGTKEAAEYARWATRMTWLDSGIIPGAFHFGASWYYKSPDKPLPAHTHDFPEILGFYGCDPQNPRELGGEVEFWIEDEKYIMTKSFLVFIPAGVKHCPLKINRIDRPMFHLGAAPAHDYVKKESK